MVLWFKLQSHVCIKLSVCKYKICRYIHVNKTSNNNDYEFTW